MLNHEEEQNQSTLQTGQDGPAGQQPAESKAEHHKCSICDSPNHQACGCEAKAQRDFKGQAGRSLAEKFEPGPVQLQIVVGEVLDRLSDIMVGIETLTDLGTSLVAMQKERADLLKDIANGKQN